MLYQAFALGLLDLYNKCQKEILMRPILTLLSNWRQETSTRLPKCAERSPWWLSELCLDLVYL